MEILSKCFEDIIKIKEGQVIGFFVAEPENLKSQHVQQEGKKENAKLLVEGQKAKRQMGGASHTPEETLLIKQQKSFGRN